MQGESLTMKFIIEPLPWMHSTTIGIATRHGACHDNIAGLSSVLIPALSRGTRNHDEKNINLLLDGRGSNYYAFTYNDYSVLLIQCLPEEVERSISLLFEFIDMPLLESKVIASEKSKMIQHIASVLDHPFKRLLMYNLERSIFGDSHPYATPRIGFMDSIKDISREALVSCIESEFLVDPMGIIIGKVDATWSRLKELMEDKMDAITSVIRDSHPPPPPVQVPAMNQLVNEDPAVENAYLGMSVRIDPDHESYIYTRFLAAMMGESFGSRMFRRIRDELGLSYIASTVSINIGDHGALSNVMDVASDRVDEAIVALGDIFVDIASNGVGEEEFYLTKNHLLGSMDIMADSPFSLIPALVLSMYHGGPGTFKGMKKAIENVKRDGIHEWMEKIFKKQALSLSVVGNVDPSLVDQTWMKFGKEVQ
ncbi:hypothetical protein GF325_09535 [Candidatus Bathyarchaeota archaeon]|nr:hypothetical protein [Candidatus Bathyarchaeota archaeon]